MTGSTLCILVCEGFRAELDAAAATASRADVTFATYPARCGRPPLTWEDIDGATSHLDASHLTLIGGCCLARLVAPPAATRQCTTTVLDNCFRLFLSRYAVESYIGAGAYLVTPGWLSDWGGRIEEWGFDRNGARDFFGESCKEILLVDTGVSPACHAQLEEFAAFVDRPFRSVPAGLELMTSHMERGIHQWRGRQEAKQLSEYALALDLLSSMTEMVDMEKVVRRILDFYHALFGAADLAYVVMADGEPVRVIHGDSGRKRDDRELRKEAAALASEYRMLPSEAGFLLAIRHDGRIIGVIRAAGIPLTKYRDQYLSLALSTAGACALVLNNARSFQRIGSMTRQLEVQKRILEGINRIFAAALGTHTDDELGRTCLAVAEEITGSRFGFIGEIGEDGLLHDTAISDPGWELCTMYDQSGHRRPPGNFEIHGLYGSVLKKGRSLVTNAPGEHPERVGTPEGHPILTSFLGVPLKEEERVTGMIALANREGGYRAEELEAVEALAPAMVVAFRRKRAEEALQQANELLEERVAQRTRELEDREARRREAERSLHEETLERLRVSESLREKERMLIQQSRLAALGEMINNIAHQWRQPLNAVGLVVQDLQMMYEFGELDHERLDGKVKRIMELICHMSDTIDDFRNFFRPDKEKAIFRVVEVVAKTLSLVEEGFRALHIEVRLDSADDPAILGYPNEYAQVLLNILINARDAFSSRGNDGKRQVRIAIYREDDKAVVTIADNAGGIPHDIIGKVFDPYFTTKGPDQGTGVGLYMAKIIIEKSMNGSLRVRNLDGGAEFRIEA